MPATEQTPANSILLIEDNVGDVTLLKKAYEKLDIAVDLKIIEDGSKASSFFESETINSSFRPNIILLDINLPGKSGLDLLKQLKEHDYWCYIPVIMWSSTENEDDILRSYKAGANAFVTKPSTFMAYKDLVGAVTKFWIHNTKLVPLRPNQNWGI